MVNRRCRAGDSITLLPGFYAKVGSDFLAQIGGCSISASSDEKPITQKLITKNKDQKISSPLAIYPNPTNRVINIAYNIKIPQQISLFLTDFSGRVIQEIINGKQPKGQYLQTIDFRNGLPYGLYNVILRIEGSIYSKKVIYQKE